MSNYTEQEIKEITETHINFSKCFYDNPLFKEIIQQVEDDLFLKFRDSTKEQADNTYYEIQGLKRLISKIYSVEQDYNTMLHSQTQTDNVY